MKKIYLAPFGIEREVIMKKLNTDVNLIATVLAMVIVLVAGSANADMVNTTFEEDSAGAGTWDLGAGSEGAWTDKDSPTQINWTRDIGNLAKYTNTTAYGGTQCGKSSGSGNSDAYAMLNFGDGGNTGTYEMTWYMKHVHAGTVKNYASVIIRDDGGDVATEVYMLWDTDDSRTVKYRAGGSSYDLMSFADDTWYKFELALDFTANGGNGEFDLTVTNTTDALDTETVSSRAFQNSAADSFDVILCKHTDPNSDTAYWDDIKVVPEPATMALLLLGLPFALRRKRK